MSIRAKFVVNSIKETLYNESVDGQLVSKILKTAELSPVYGNSEENKKFFKWTPSGRIELGLLNEEAAKQLIIGQSYYVDFTKAE